MRRVRRKGGNKEKVFGCDLLEHLTTSCQEVPQVLQCCSDFVEKHGIVDGIYRLSGVSSNIQKLRGEFENDGSPDLNKDLYLQDIHCVSSLCKAYFRELPNPLLTYQLYDKFAEAVAIQLEEERLVKIRDVLKELPAPHYRTLEFLMRHLVKMASYSSETNMHSRNLAIVWAPNLLRSKDIEASGFNGTAAFMEVRVQSIVVEFILTHVPQLFPEQGASYERRKSLPSPSAIHNQEEGFYKAAPSQPVPHFGHISPGDGPLPIRPYHAIIEGTDKRKGSLKGRKWMSIFNIGGRFHDPRRRHKHSAKEKERPALRPARSMDSLSTSLYSNEDSRRSGQRPPSTNMSPLVTSSPHPCSDVSSSASAIGGSEYAVTYRRGTGLVGGGAGTQGTYTSLDPEGLGLMGNETLQSRSPGLSTKGRRAAMHITGPTIVTVPLHITSNLALGVLQGGGDRVIHRGRDKEGGDRVEGKEGGERKKSRGMEMKAEERGKVEEQEKNPDGKVRNREGITDVEGKIVVVGDEEESGKKKEEERRDEEKEVREESSLQPELVVRGQSVSREQRSKSLTSKTEEGNGVDEEYIEMKAVKPADYQPEVTQSADDCVFDASDVLNSTEVEGNNQELSGYVQDNFEFLDQMDCSVLDHMDCSVSYQMNEFSVEPPGHSDDEYEVMEQAHPPELQVDQQPGSETQTQSPAELNPHRPLSLDSHSHHTKSLSLPYMTSPIHRSEGSCSDEEATVDDSDDDYYCSEEDENMFIKSLPADFFLDNLTFEPEEQDSCSVPSHQSQSSDDLELSACKESSAGDLEQVEDKDGLEEKEIIKQEEEDQQATDQLENNKQSKPGENQSDKEQPLIPEPSTHCCIDFPPLSDDESSTVSIEEEYMFDCPHRDYPPCDVPCAAQKEMDDVSLEELRDFSAKATDQPTKERDSEEGEDKEQEKEMEDIMILQIKESVENKWEEKAEECDEVTAEETYEDEERGGDKEQDNAPYKTSGAIWVELEDVICEVIEDEEKKQVEMRDEGSAAVDGDTVKAGVEEEQVAKVSEEDMVDADETETNDTEVRVEESSWMTEEKLTQPERQKDCEAKEMSELEEAVQGKHAVCNEAQHHDRKEVVSKESNDEERAEEEHRMKQQSTDKQLSCDTKELEEGRKCEHGVGRKLVISKHPRVYQVKAVPVVPPKPQHCKITALTLRQQQQQREKRDADRWRENSSRVPAEREKVCAGDDGEDDGRVEKEKEMLWGGEKGEQERRRDGEESVMRETSRNSPLSISFDEAVAIATMRREKEKECEKEKERQRDWGNEVQ